MAAGIFFDMFVILSAAVWLVKLAAENSLSANGAALILLALVAVRAAGRARHISVIRQLFGIGLPLASLFMFTKSYGNGDPRQMVALLYLFGVLIVILLGYYVMFLGAFRGQRMR